MGRGKNRGRGWSWGIFCMEDMDESSTQFLSLLWSSPLVFFLHLLPQVGISWSRCWNWWLWEENVGWGGLKEGSMLREFCKAQQSTCIPVLDGKMSQHHSPAHSWGVPGTRERIGVHQKSYPPCNLVSPGIQNQSPDCVKISLTELIKCCCFPFLHKNLWNSHRWILLWITRNLLWPSQFAQ